MICAIDHSNIPISAYLGENEGKFVNCRSFQCAGDLAINSAHFTLGLILCTHLPFRIKKVHQRENKDRYS